MFCIGSRDVITQRNMFDFISNHLKILILSFLVVLLSFIFLVFGSSVEAQIISPKLSVSPHTFEFSVFPGEADTGIIEIKNRGNVALPISVKIVDFSASDENGGISFSESDQDVSFAARKWIKVKNPNFILSSDETERVHFTIKIPKNAEPGGHYASILFEPRLPSYYFKKGKPRVIPVIGVLFLFSVKTLSLNPQAHQKLDIVEFSIPKNNRIIALENMISMLLFREKAEVGDKIVITKQYPQNFILRIKNNDIYHIRPYGKLLIYNIFGKEVGKAKIPQETILPGRTRIFSVHLIPTAPKKLKWLPSPVFNLLSRNLFFGKYKAEVKLKAESPLIASVFYPNAPIALTFFSFSWKLWLVLFLILALSVLSIVKFKKRIELAIRTLFHSS